MGFACVADGFFQEKRPRAGLRRRPRRVAVASPLASDYRRRAIHWALKEKFLRYDDFETILMAPAAFIRANADCARQFDRCLPYEELAIWIPLFAEAVGIPEQV